MILVELTCVIEGRVHALIPKFMATGLPTSMYDCLKDVAYSKRVHLQHLLYQHVLHFTQTQTTEEVY